MSLVVGTPLPKDIAGLLADIETLRVTEGVVGKAMEAFGKEFAEEEAVYSDLSSLDFTAMDRVKTSIVEHLESAKARTAAMCTELDAMHASLKEIIRKNNALLRHTEELSEYLDGVKRVDILDSKRGIMQKIADIQSFLVDEGRLGKNATVHYYDPSMSSGTDTDRVILHVRVGSVDGNSITLFEDLNPGLFTDNVLDRHATLLVGQAAVQRPDNDQQWRAAYVSRTGQDFKRKNKMLGLYNLEVHKPGKFVKLTVYGMVGEVEPGDELYICLGLDEVHDFNLQVLKLF